MRRIIVDLVDIDNDRHSRLPCLTCRLERGSGVATIQMKDLPVGVQIAAQLDDRMLQCQIASPQNCAFADTFFDENDCDLAACAVDFSNVQFQLFLAKAGKLRLAPTVASYRTDITRCES